MVRRCAVISFCLLCLSAAASAQNAPRHFAGGRCRCSRFPGTVVAGTPAGDAQRIDKTYINLGGPALRVIGLDRLRGPAQGQLVGATKKFTAMARQIGQVFSVALDDATPPNIYAAATSAYGLPIVVPDADGNGLADRARRGEPGAAYMPGLFGPTGDGGGPGSIWKINGATGALSLFANVTLDGVRNSGPALGGLAFDPASHQLFVADRDTGMIHRFTLDGVDRGRFDHGAQGLAAAQLPPVPFDPRKRIDLQNPVFDSTTRRPGAMRRRRVASSAWRSIKAAFTTRWRLTCASGQSRICAMVRSEPTHALKSPFRRERGPARKSPGCCL